MEAHGRQMYIIVKSTVTMPLSVMFISNIKLALGRYPDLLLCKWENLGASWGEVNVIYKILNVRKVREVAARLPSLLSFFSFLNRSMKHISLSISQIRGASRRDEAGTHFKPSFPVFCFTFFGIAQVSTIARLSIRYRHKRLWWDDFCKYFLRFDHEFTILINSRGFLWDAIFYINGTCIGRSWYVSCTPFK